MGNTSTKEAPAPTAVNKVATKAEKVIKSVNGDIKAAAGDVKKGVNKAAGKTSKSVTKAGKDVSKAVDDLLADPKEEKKSHTTQVVVGVPLVALVVAAGYYLWKTKPWKKSDDGAKAA